MEKPLLLHIVHEKKGNNFIYRFEFNESIKIRFGGARDNDGHSIIIII